MRRLLPVTLTGRLVLTAIGLIAVVGILVALTTSLLMRQQLTQQLDRRLEDSAQRAQHNNKESRPGPGGDDPDHDGLPPMYGPVADVGTLLAFLNNGPDEGGVVTPSKNAPRLTTDLTQHELDELGQVPADGHPHDVDLDRQGGYRVIATPIQIDGNRVTLVTGLPTHDRDSAITTMLLAQLLLTLAGIIVAAFVGARLVRRNLRPLRQVARTAHEVSVLPLDTGEVGRTARVPEELTDPATEVGQVGLALNNLLGHVERSLDARHRQEQQVRQFVADASHELRTPLATIRGYAELARRSPEYDPVDALAKVEEEGVRMHALVEDLLLLARLDSGRPLEDEEVDLTMLALQTVEDARVVGRDHHWALALPDEPVQVNGDEQRLHQVLSNLLANARRHTPAGTTVEVALARQNGNAVLSVTDDGPGIPAELQADVFDRFTRADASRTRDSGGAGLGLALVQAIVTAHDGSVSVDSHPGRTRFTVTLPAPH
jgi:two-component system OmpR family sensor kinase